MLNSSNIQVLAKSFLPARSDLHIARKLWHMGVGSLFLYIYFLGAWSQQTWAILALSIAVIGFSADFIRLRSKKTNELWVKLFGTFLRESEREAYSGLPFYALGCGLSLLLFRAPFAELSVIFLVFSDPISSYFGIRFGKTKILPNKSLQGAAAGFCTCYLATLVYGILTTQVSVNLLGYALIAGFIGSVSELLSVFVDDNLTIPVVSGAGLTFLNLFFNVF